MSYLEFYRKHQGLVQKIINADIDTNSAEGIQKPSSDTALAIIFDICNPNYGKEAKDYGLGHIDFTGAKADYKLMIAK